MLRECSTGAFQFFCICCSQEQILFSGTESLSMLSKCTSSSFPWCACASCSLSPVSWRRSSPLGLWEQCTAVVSSAAAGLDCCPRSHAC